ncbi:jg404, partial [Pararge aegeria aegeria]
VAQAATGCARRGNDLEEDELSLGLERLRISGNNE